jgi:hypothetical protein
MNNIKITAVLLFVFLDLSLRRIVNVVKIIFAGVAGYRWSGIAGMVTPGVDVRIVCE